MSGAHAPGRRRAAALVFLAATLVSYAVREVNHLRTPFPSEPEGAGAWFSADPDGLYHMRRVERALAEGRVAARDPFLAFPDGLEGDPEGAAVPWPPYYDQLLAALLAPFAPADPGARHGFVERAVARVPAVLSALTSGLVALAVLVLLGGRYEPRAALAGALFAGLYHAFLFASLRYGYVGNGDHHAWVSLLLAATWLLVSAALRAETPRAGAALGAAAGTAAGVAVGSWVASIVSAAVVGASLWMAALAAGARAAHVARVGLGFFAAALAACLPAVLASPWARERPWSVVELSVFHALALALGAAAFGLLAAARGALARRAWSVGLCLSAGAVAAWLAARHPGALAEAADWAAARSPFMAHVRESRSPLEDGALLHDLGLAAPLALPALLFAFVAVWRGRLELAPWAIGAALLAFAALAQRRFGEPFGVPLAVILGWALARVAARVPRRVPVVAAAVLAGVATQPGVARTTLLRLGSRERPVTVESARAQGQRELAAWLAEAGSPSPEVPGPAVPPWGVLAQWDLGHLVAWAGRRPIVATNFGAYVGSGWRVPWRVLLSREDADAEALLVEHRVRYVLLTATWRRNLAAMQRAVEDGGDSLHPEALVARLMRQVGGPLPRDLPLPPPDATDPGFLRLVHVSPRSDPLLRSADGPAAAGWIFERVSGARLVACGRPGEELRVSVRLEAPGLARDLLWVGRALAADDGCARLRIPYSTEGSDAVVSWSMAGRRGEAAISEEAVRSGQEVRVEGGG